MATMNISLPDAMKDWVEAQVATGRYANVSDFVRDVLRREQEQRDLDRVLRSLLAEADASGEALVPDLERVWRKAVARFEARGGVTGA